MTSAVDTHKYTHHPLVQFLAGLATKQEEQARQIEDVKARLSALGRGKRRDVLGDLHSFEPPHAFLPMFQITGLPDLRSGQVSAATNPPDTRTQIAQMLAPILENSSPTQTVPNSIRYKLITDQIRNFNNDNGGEKNDFYHYASTVHSVDLEDIRYDINDLPELIQIFANDISLPGNVLAKGPLSEASKQFLQNIYTLITADHLAKHELDVLDEETLVQYQTALDEYFNSDVDTNAWGETLKATLLKDGFDKHRALLLVATLRSAVKMSEAENIELKFACDCKFTQLDNLHKNFKLGPSHNQPGVSEIRSYMNQQADPIYDQGQKDPRKQVLLWIREFNQANNAAHDGIDNHGNVVSNNLLAALSGSKIALGMIKDALETGLFRDLVQTLVNTAENDVIQTAIAGQDNALGADLSNLRKFDSKFIEVVEDMHALLTFRALPNDRCNDLLGLVQSLETVDRNQGTDLALLAMHFVQKPLDIEVQKQVRNKLPEILAILIYDSLNGDYPLDTCSRYVVKLQQ